MGPSSIFSIILIGCITAAAAQSSNADQFPQSIEVYPPPKELSYPMKTESRILISGGPTNPYEIAKAAQILSQMGVFENGTVQIMEEIKDGLRYVFQTKNEWTLALTGHGYVAVEAVLDNLIEPGDVILVPIYGVWAQRVTDSAQRLGGIVKNIAKPYGATFSYEEIESSIQLHKPNVLYLTHGESSTGVRQQIQGIGHLCRKYDCLLIVDVVATLGVMPFHFDDWKIDAAFCNSQKGLGSPVGLAPITFGPRAIEKMMRRKTKPVSYRTDFKNWIETNYWNIDKSRGQLLHHSFPVLQLYALREALAQVAVEKLENVWSRHQNATDRFYQGIEDINLKYFVPHPQDRLTGTVVLHPPTNLLPKDMANFLREKFQMDMGIGLGPTYGKVFRIAFLGPNANFVIVDQVLHAFKVALDHFGVRSP